MFLGFIPKVNLVDDEEKYLLKPAKLNSYRKVHFLNMYISIISKVGHAPLFRADIRGSEVTHTHVHTVRLSTYNTIQYNIYVYL